MQKIQAALTSLQAGVRMEERSENRYTWALEA